MDPPGIVQVWNEAFVGRGAARLPTSTPFECYVLAKPYFDREGLIVAEEDGVIVGFAHAGFGANEAGSDIAIARGVICALGVRPRQQRRGPMRCRMSRAGARSGPDDRRRMSRGPWPGGPC